jgi:hypothetical protein
LGSLTNAGGTTHAGYDPSPVDASSLPFTSSFRANDITVDRV